MRSIPPNWVETNLDTSLCPYQRRSRKSLTKRSPLMNVLKHHKGVEYEEWRDKVFALRALAQEGDRIQVDYRITRAALFFQVLHAVQGSFCLCFAFDLLEILRPDHHDPVKMSSLHRGALQTVVEISGVEAELLLDWTQYRHLMNSSTAFMSVSNGIALQSKDVG